MILGLKVAIMKRHLGQPDMNDGCLPPSRFFLLPVISRQR